MSPRHDEGWAANAAAALTGAARTKAIEDTLSASDSGKWALGIVKKCAARVNGTLGQLPMEKVQRIARAAAIRPPEL